MVAPDGSSESIEKTSDTHSRNKARWESSTYIAVLAALAGWQLATAFALDFRPNFGFRQLRQIGLAGSVVAFVILASVLFYSPLFRWVRGMAQSIQDALYSHWLYRAAVGAFAGVVFFSLRTGMRNYDSRVFPQKFAFDVPRIGAHVTHDEMWELYLHSRFWFYSQQWWGWSVDLSYQTLSCLVGVAFILMAFSYCRELLASRALPLFCILISGASMQLFFGDVENYTLTACWILAYLFSSAAYLQKRVSILWPSALLAVAMTFHLLAGFLGPSLLYLHWREIRGGRPIESAKGVALASAIVLGTLTFFHFNHLPIRNLYYHSYAFGQGGVFRDVLVTPSVMYYKMQFQLLALMCPAWVVLVPMLAYRRIRWEPINIHLALATAFMLLFQVSWAAQLGVYWDWNLFANVSFPLAMLIGYNLLREPELLHRWRIVLAVVFIASLHSYSWIYSNHTL